MAEREKQYKGIISYEKLWNLMQTKNIKKRELSLSLCKNGTICSILLWFFSLF